MCASFAAQVGEWATATETRFRAVVQTAAQDLANEVRVPKGAGGNMPVKTGNLRRSLLASTSAMPQVVTDSKVQFADSDGQISLAILNAELGDTIYLGFQAAYARRMEYGFVGEDSLGRKYNQQGNGFVRLAAQRWQDIVDAAARTVKEKVEG